MFWKLLLHMELEFRAFCILLLLVKIGITCKNIFNQNFKRSLFLTYKHTTENRTLLPSNKLLRVWLRNRKELPSNHYNIPK